MSRKPTPKKGAPPKPRKVYIAVREVAHVNTSFTEPDRVFASKTAAQEYADALNRELRTSTNPFADDNEPGFLMKDEAKLWKLLKTFNVAEPTPPKGGYMKWDRWWAQVAAELTEEQRDAVWDVFDRFEWFKVTETTLEG